MIRVRDGKKGKRYQVRVHTGGGKYKVLGTFKTRQEARRAEAKWEVERKTPDKILCRDFAERFLQHYRETRKVSSYDHAKSAIDFWLREFGNRSLHTLTRDECRTWAASANPDSGKLNRWAARPVITMLNEALEEGLIDRNPMKGTAPQTRGRKNKKPLTVAEVDELSSIAKDLWGDFMWAFVRFAAYSGMRSGEIFALRWDAVNLPANRVQVRARLYRGDIDLPKTNTVSEIGLLPEAREAVLTMDRNSDWVFTGKRGTQLTRPQLVYYWNPIRAAFGRNVTPHELRHFLGHHLYVTLGYPARDVAGQLTHTTPALVETLYGHGDHGAVGRIMDSYEERSNVVPIQGHRRANTA